MCALAATGSCIRKLSKTVLESFEYATTNMNWLQKDNAQAFVVWGEEDKTIIQHGEERNQESTKMYLPT